MLICFHKGNNLSLTSSPLCCKVHLHSTGSSRQICFPLGERLGTAWQPETLLVSMVAGSRLKAPQFQEHLLGMSPRASHASHQQKNENLIVLVGSLPAKTISMVQCTCSHMLHCIKKSPGETIKKYFSVCGCTIRHAQS